MSLKSQISSVLFQWHDDLKSKSWWQSCGIVIISIIYIFLLLWFAHVDILIQTIGVENSLNVRELLLQKHASFISFITNWGLLVMLYLDLWISNRLNPPKTITFLNLFGVLSIICLFWFSTGCLNVQIPNNSFGSQSTTEYAFWALAVFAVILFYLKYYSLKPQR